MILFTGVALLGIAWPPVGDAIKKIVNAVKPD